jgi:ATP-dependent Lon protease
MEKTIAKKGQFEEMALLQQQPVELPLLPLKNMAILPKSILPIIVGRDFSISAVEAALKQDRMVFITAQKQESVEKPAFSDVFAQGTRAVILQVMRLQNGSLKILAEGISRSNITDFSDNGEFITVKCHDIYPETIVRSSEIDALWRELRELYLSYSELNDKAPKDIIDSVKTMTDIDYATDTIAVHITNMTLEERQSIVGSVDLKNRILILCSILTKELDILQTKQRIHGHIQNQVEKNQREYYLTEQIKAIQKELGREDLSSEIESLREKINKTPLSKEARQRAEKELHRLEQMPPLSSEAVVSRHYLDWILSVPWEKESQDTISITQAEKILDRQHFGLIKAKERIIEFIAAKKFSKQLKRSPIMCLVGPPGVGKTSLARSIAESVGREFVRISLGGIRDEAEIRGHRRTYIGALPGKIIHAMKQTGTTNPVILLDEIDKLSRDFAGDPASALLEVLDPEQNKYFNDHFLDMQYDLSQVMFIATANVADNIPYALLDRLELISLSGYTDAEKKEIAKQFIIPKLLKEHDLQPRQCKISDEILLLILEEYTKEAGVRQLERVLSKLIRKSILKLLEDEKRKSVVITKELLTDWLGHQIHRKMVIAKNLNERIGIATGLAWTEVGGDVLEVEISVLPGKGNILLTGQLGEVMQESAQAALSYIRSRAKELGLSPSFYSSKDIHIHLPEGATPKDGPSAGITIATALVSALTKIPTKADVAMTGEITLQGRVFPIGGLKEKLLAARQHDCTTVLVPHENDNEIKDIEKEISLDGLSIIFVKNMDEVIERTLTKNPFNTKIKAKKKDISIKPAKKIQHIELRKNA